LTSRGNASVGSWQAVSAPVTARYIRFYFKNPNGDPQVGGISEVQIRAPISTATSTTSGADIPTETPIPTTEPTEEPTQEPTAQPTETLEPSPTETLTVTVTETATETASPTEEPTDVPTDEPIVEPTEEPENAVVEEIPTPYVVARTIRTRGSDSGNVLIDGDPATVWYGESRDNATEVSVTLDLGRPRSIGTVRVLVSTEGVSGNLRVETSRNRRDWTEVPSNVDGMADQWVDLVPEDEVAGRFVRLTFVSADSAQVGGVAEVEVWP
jgi:hypothetical protein